MSARARLEIKLPRSRRVSLRSHCSSYREGMENIFEFCCWACYFRRQRRDLMRWLPGPRACACMRVWWWWDPEPAERSVWAIRARETSVPTGTGQHIGWRAHAAPPAAGVGGPRARVLTFSLIARAAPPTYVRVPTRRRRPPPPPRARRPARRSSPRVAAMTAAPAGEDPLCS